MPSTTNALEALHGQLNRRIPRRNNLWNLAYRLAQIFLLKNNSLNDQIVHNYNFEKLRTISHGFNIQKRINDEIKKYHSSRNQCQCSGNRLISCILGNVPWIHRVFNDAQFPDCPIVKLKSKSQWNELIVEINPLEEEKLKEQISTEKIDLNYIVEMIYKYSKCMKREKIEEYISPLSRNEKNRRRIINKGYSEFCSQNNSDLDRIFE